MKLSKIATYIWVAGGIAVLIGEAIDATDDETGDTISERFKGLHQWVKLLIFAVIGGVLTHLAEWRIRDAVEAAAVESAKEN